MNRYRAVRCAANDQLIERRLKFEDMQATPQAFVEWLVTQERWDRAEAVKELARLQWMFDKRKGERRIW